MTRLRQRSHDAIPFGRVTIAAQVLTALVVAFFLFTSTGVRVPFSSRGDTLQAFVPDAAGLHPPNRPEVTVAGVKAGTVKSVDYDTRRRRARIVLRLDSGVRRKLFADASIRIVPRSALNDLVVDVRPGTPGAGPLRGDTITDAAPAPVGYDRVLDVMDDDTSTYAQILIGTLGQVLRNRPGQLRDAVRRLPSVTRTVDTLAAQLARRRENLSRLVTHLDEIAAGTATRSTQLTSALLAARRALAVTARRQTDVEQAVNALPATLTQTDRAFAGLARLGRPLDPALRRLRASVRQLPPALAAVDALLPTLGSTTGRLDALTRRGGTPLRSLRRAVTTLGPTVQRLRRLPPFASDTVHAIADNESGFSRILDFWPGALASQNRTGVLTDFALLGSAAVNPKMFGLPVGNANGDAKVAALVRSLATRQPKLFDLPAPLRRASPPIRGFAALVNGLCLRGNTGACLVISSISKQPPVLAR